MRLRELSGKFDGVIDVFAICDGGRDWVDDAYEAFGRERVNPVFFTPSTSRKAVWR